MNRLDGFGIVLVAVALAVPGFVVGQTPPPAPTTQKTLAATMNVYEKLALTCPDLKPLAEDRIRKIRVERGIFFP